MHRSRTLAIYLDQKKAHELEFGQSRQMDETQAVAAVLEAFADAGRRLYDLQLQLPRESNARRDVRIHQAGNGATSYTVAHLAATRSNGSVVIWSVSLRAGAELVVNSEVEVEPIDDDSSHSMFHRSEVAGSAVDAVRLIREMTEEVAQQVGAFSDG